MLMNLPELLRNNKLIKLKRYKPIKNSRRAEIWYKRELLLFVKQLRDEIESAVENNRTFFRRNFTMLLMMIALHYSTSSIA
ncbi:hypothetical protein [Avibacterium paragallinarum]|uniref:hypothetical protein n=1 Tax=Avibacterium paragallinarum TaxID=728 RepID=UPI003989A30B